MAVLQQKEVKDGFLTDASAELEKAALAAVRTGKKATVTLTLNIEPQKGSAISIGATINAKAPSTKEDSFSLFFVNNEGGLQRNDPRQSEMKFSAHDGGATNEQPAEAAQAAN
jgi:hypothetical protein